MIKKLKTLLIFRREFAGYFATPLATVFLVVFLAISAGMTFFVANFFDRGQADMNAFFLWHPWLYLVLMPAIGMRLWAEERRSGTIELLMTLPVRPWQLVVGKWLAAWAFAGLALALSAPNLTMLLDRLQERGLLWRERSQVDRRSQNVVLTEEGERIARVSAEAASTMELALFDRLSRAEHAMLIELLRKVAAR